MNFQEFLFSGVVYYRETCIINLSATRTRPLKETKNWLGLSEITELIGQDNERERRENTRLLLIF